MRKATKKDVKVGNILHNEYGDWKITSKYDEGIYEARNLRLDRLIEGLIFSSEAQFYTVTK